MLPRATAEFYRAQQQLGLMTVAAVRREWAAMGDHFDQSWLTVGPRVKLLSASAQLGAARQAEIYVPKVLAETGQHAPAEGDIDPASFAGYATDGRSLDGLLYGAVTRAKSAVGQGDSPEDALASGQSWLDGAVQTLVADAGRVATGVAIVSRPKVGGYVRMLQPPSCNRCAVLAGKWYRYNDGFQRHPRCDCVHIPAGENMAGDLRTDPRLAIEAGQVTGLSAAETKAIVEDGADVSQVINAARGMEVSTLFGQRLSITLEGTTRRGVAGTRLAEQFKKTASRFANSGTGAVRLTPESIYKVAGSRANAIRLLRQYGYLT